MSHDQPTYASVPGIRVYGMMCVNKTYSASPTPTTSKRKARPLRDSRSLRIKGEIDLLIRIRINQLIYFSFNINIKKKDPILSLTY